MDKEALGYLWALRKVNDAILVGLETAVHTMENWDELSSETRESTIKSVKGLIAQSKAVYGGLPTEH